MLYLELFSMLNAFNTQTTGKDGNWLIGKSLLT